MALAPGAFGIAAAISALALGACTKTPSTTHLHGPKSQPMKNADMQPAPPCTVDGQHPMPGPRGGAMSKEAHPGCQSDKSAGAP